LGWLKNKICIVTGAGRGIGQTIALRFVEEGAKIVLVDIIDLAETENLIKNIRDLDVEEKVFHSVKCDIKLENEIVELFQQVSNNFGDRVDILVNNAALFCFKSVEDASVADWENMCAVNIIGTALMTKHVIPFMKASGGAIVCINSISGVRAQPNCVTYSTMKGALLQFVRNCAFDLAKHKIRVNSVCPGTITTPISYVEMKEQGWSFDEWQQLKIKDVILGRVGRTDEVANAVLFLSSDESSYTTGSEIFVDGGQSACTVMF